MNNGRDGLYDEFKHNVLDYLSTLNISEEYTDVPRKDKSKIIHRKIHRSESFDSSSEEETKT